MAVRRRAGTRATATAGDAERSQALRGASERGRGKTGSASATGRGGAVMSMLLMGDARLFVIEALDQGQRVVGRCVLRAYDRDQAARWAKRLLCWQVGTITLAEAGWS